jgi:hypothetical protein
MNTPKFSPFTEDEFKGLSTMEDAWREYSSLADEVNRYAQFQSILERQLPKWVMPTIMIGFALLICFAPWFWSASVPADITVSEKSAISIANHVNGGLEKIDLGPVLAEIKKIPVTSATDLKPVLEAIARVPTATQSAEVTASKVGLMFTDGFVGDHPEYGRIRFFSAANGDGTAPLSWIKEGETPPAVATTDEEKK